MNGMDAKNGKKISGLEHVLQSISDILTTPIGSRIFRPDYGSDLFNLTDKPLNSTTLLKIFAATADALARWEPRISVTNVRAERIEAGRITVSIDATYLPTGQKITANGINL